MNLQFEIVPVELGERGALYSIRYKGEKNTELDKFLACESVQASEEYEPLVLRLYDMVVNLGFVVPFGAKPKHVVAQSPAPAPVATPVVQAHTTDCSTLDSDHDGVNDCADQCPNTPAGAHVAINGCWTVEVKFDNDKAIIKPQYFSNLDNAANIIKNNPELIIEVQGHTSKTGSLKHNIKLSESRALAVKKYLVHDTHSPHLTTQGYGWTRPIDTNDTEEGRSNNRRVQLEVNGNQAK